MESKARKQWLKVQHELRSGCLVCFRNKTGIWFLRMLFLCNAVRRRRKNREAEDTEGRSINEVTGGHGIQEEKLDLEEKRHPSPRRMRWGDLCLRKSINIHRSAQMASYLLNHIKRGGWLLRTQRLELCSRLRTMVMFYDCWSFRAGRSSWASTKKRMCQQARDGDGVRVPKGNKSHMQAE